MTKSNTLTLPTLENAELAHTKKILFHEQVNFQLLQRYGFTVEKSVFVYCKVILSKLT